MGSLEGAGCLQGPDPFVVDALGVDHLATGGGGVHLPRRAHRVIDDEDAMSPVQEAERGVGDAHVGLQPDEDRGPPTCAARRDETPAADRGLVGGDRVQDPVAYGYRPRISIASATRLTASR